MLLEPLDARPPRSCTGKRQLSAGRRFSAANFGEAVSKRFRSARESLLIQVDRVGVGSSAKQGSFASSVVTVPSHNLWQPPIASTVNQKVFGSTPSILPARSLQNHRTSSLPPGSLDLLTRCRASAPPVASRTRSLPRLGLHPLWEVSGITTGSVGCQKASLTSQMGYLEYLTWLQKAVPDGELRPPVEEEIDAKADQSTCSGLELLRNLSKAAAPKAVKGVTPLTEEEKELGEDGLWGDGPGSEVLASRFSVDLTRRQLQCCRPGEWLNDEVINFYFKLLQERSIAVKDLPKCWFVNSFFWGKVSTNTEAYSFKDVKRWSTKAKIDVFAMDYVIFPMNIGETHWAMGAIDLKEKGFRYFDSMFSRPHKNFVPFLRRYVDDEHKAKKGGPLAGIEDWELIKPEKPVPQQKNGFDCGVFTCNFGEYFSAGKSLTFRQEDMPDLRVRLAARVIKADEHF